MIRITLASALALALSTHAFAHDTGEFNDLPPDVRAKFFGSPGIQICCAEADGHRVSYRGSFGEGYEIQLNGQWIPVPPESVVTEPTNPTLEGIAWYRVLSEGVHVECFSPAAGM